MVGKLIKNMGFLVEEVNIKFHDKEYTSYSEALKDLRCMEIMAEAASEVMNSFSLMNEKKI
jgi:hypothetical protein